MSKRVEEANRIRPIFASALGSLENFLRTIERSNLKPKIVDRAGHVAVRFDKKLPEEALLLKFARLVSLNRAMILLSDEGFVQEQGIIQRAIEETNEDIMFFSINITGSGNSDKFESFLQEFWKEDYEDPSDPVGTRIPRAYTRKGIGSFLNRVFDQPNPSSADGAAKTIYNMYSGFTHGAAPQILELYDYEGKMFLVNGIQGTNRHLDYIFDAQNSVYRSLLSAVAIAKAFGSKELLKIATNEIDAFVGAVGRENLEKTP